MKQKWKLYYPFFVAAGMVLVSIFLWQLLLAREENEQNKITEIQLKSAKMEINERLNQYAFAIQRMATRIEYLGTKDKVFLDLDSKSYLSNLKGLKRIGLTNSQLQVIWSYPEDMSQQVIAFDQGQEKKRKAAFEASLKEDWFTLSEKIELKSGGSGFLLPIPLFSKKRECSGFLYATIDSHLFFQQISSFKDYNIQIFSGDDSVYAREIDSVAAKAQVSKTDDFRWGLAPFKMEMSPTSENVKSHQSHFPELVLAVGLFFSMATGLYLYLLMLSRRQRSQLIVSEKRFRLLVENAKDYAIFMLDPEGYVTTWNEGAQRIKGYAPEEVIGRHFSIFYPVNDRTLERCRKELEIAKNFGKFEEEDWRLGKDGTLIWANVSIARLNDDAGTLIGFSEITKDLTRQKKVEEALRESQERFDFIARGTKQGVFEQNLVTKELYISMTGKQLLGIAEDKGGSLDDWSSRVHPEDKSKLMMARQNYLEKKSASYEVEYRYLEPDGKSFKWLEASGHASWNSAGLPIKLAGTVRDITERKKAEEEIKELNLFNKTIFENSPSAITVFDADGKFIVVNEALLRLSGASREMVMQQNITLLESWNRSGLLDSFQQAVDMGKKVEFHVDLDTIAGRRISIYGAFVPINISGQQQIIFHAADVTELRKAHETERLYRAALDHSAAVYFTNKDGEITHLNQLACTLSGYSREEMIGKKLAMLRSGQHPEAFFGELWQTITSGRSWHGEVCNRDKSGNLYWVNTTIVPNVGKNGVVEQHISVQLDITHEKKTELQLSQSSKMSALGEMAGGIAHEINNPLAIILANAQMLKRRGEAQVLDIAKVKKSADTISLTADRIAKIISGLKTFSRDGTEDPMKDMSVLELINNTLEFCKARFQKYEVAIRVDHIEPSLMVEGQDVQLSQVILNLLNNAFDAIVALANPSVEIQARLDSDDFVEISVMDSGLGIPSEIAAKIMQPFFTTKEVGAGTGLGLSVSSGIIKSHQGTLSLDSTCKNTRFVIRLPRRQRERKNAA